MICLCLSLSLEPGNAIKAVSYSDALSLPNSQKLMENKRERETATKQEFHHKAGLIKSIKNKLGSPEIEKGSLNQIKTLATPFVSTEFE